MRALIVEDELITGVVLKRILTSEWECDFVVNGKDAVDAFIGAWEKGAPHDLICLDVIMPEMNGLEVLKAIREYEAAHAAPRKVKIIMTSALSSAADVSKAHALGCDSYLVKPIIKQQLEAELRRLGLLKNPRATI